MEQNNWTKVVKSPYLPHLFPTKNFFILFYRFSSFSTDEKQFYKREKNVETKNVLFKRFQIVAPYGIALCANAISVMERFDKIF